MAAGVRLTALAAFLRAGTRQFAWGACDCCTWACDWICAQRGVDPSAPLRGRYRTALGAQRHIRRAGGLVALVGHCMASAGVPETDDPSPGDVGVVETPDGDALAIRTAIGWAVKGEGSVVVMPCRHKKAWAV